MSPFATFKFDHIDVYELNIFFKIKNDFLQSKQTSSVVRHGLYTRNLKFQHFISKLEIVFIKLRY